MTQHDGFRLAADQSRGGPQRFFGLPVRMLATGVETGGSYTLLEQEHERDYRTPLHVHSAEDEAFYVIEGELLVACGAQRWEVGPGGFVFLPRSVPHAIAVVSDRARLLQLSDPSGFEDFTDEVADVPLSEENLPLIADAAARDGIEIIGPPPFDAGS